jgi:outer membrane protein assembly factor BamB
LLDRQYLGGVGTGDGTAGEGLFSARVATGQTRNAPAAYTTASGTYVVFSGGGTGVGCPGTPGDLVALRIDPASPPAFSVAWCAANNGRGSPIVTTTDGFSNPIVWTVGAEGTNRLYAHNGETGETLFDGGSSDDQMTLVRRFSTPIVADGRIFVAADDRLYAFTTQSP